MRDDGIVLYEIEPRVGFGPALRPAVEHHKGIDALTVVRKAGYKPSMESIALEFTVKQVNDRARIGDALDRVDEVESCPAYLSAGHARVAPAHVRHSSAIVHPRFRLQ